MIKRFYQKTQSWPWPLLVSLLILGFTCLLPLMWFGSHQLLFRGDPIYPLDPVRYLGEQWFQWVGKVNLGEPGVRIAALPYQFIQALPALLGAPTSWAEKIHFMVWLTMPGITLFFLMEELVRRLQISRWATPIAISYYLFNLYRLAQFVDNNHLVIYAALPLGLLFTIRAFDLQRSWVAETLKLSLTSLIITQAGTNPPMYLMFWLPVIGMAIVLGLGQLKHWQRTLKIGMLLLIATVLINLFWLVPFIQINLRQTSLNGSGNLDWLNELSNQTSPGRVIRLMGAWDWFSSWEGEPYAPFAWRYLQPFWWWLTLVPALLIIPLAFVRKAWNRYVLVIFLIGLFGLIFSHGTHPPFTEFYRWAVKHLPFFWSFRSPWYKFTNLTALSYAILIGLSVGYWLKLVTSKRVASRLVTSLLVTGIIVLPLVITHPFITGGRWIKPGETKFVTPDIVPYPEHIRQAATWLNSQPGNSAVGLLPYMPSEIYRWGYASLVDPMFYLSRRPILIRGDRVGYPPGETPGGSVGYRVFVEQLYSDDQKAEKVAELLGLEFLVIRNDLRFDYYHGQDGPGTIKKHLAAMPHFRYERSFGEWDIYHFDQAQEQPVRATTRIDRFIGHPIDALASILNSVQTVDGSFPAILFEQPVKQVSNEIINQVTAALDPSQPAPKLSVTSHGTTYSISGTGNQPFLLTLNQRADPGWQLTASRSPDNNQPKIGPQVISYGYAPTWLVKPSGSFNLTISYQPQNLILPSFLASLIAIGLAIGYLLIGKNKSRSVVTASSNYKG